jgi:hypothetical protein
VATDIDITCYQGGADFPLPKKGRATKTALKHFIKEEPHNVFLYDTTDTALGGPKWEGMAIDLPKGVVFNVVGPDPFADRSWCASIYRNKKGGLAVK